MQGLMAKYPSEAMDCIGPRPMTLSERLKNRKAEITRQLDEVSKAVDALEKNPELQNLLDIVSRVC